MTAETKADLRVLQATAYLAAERMGRAEVDDEGLTLHDIEQDEATRRPMEARRQRRLAIARRVRNQRRFNRMVARQQVALRLATPAPSRGAVRLFERLQREALIENQEVAA